MTKTAEILSGMQARIDELEEALRDLLNDCINFDGGKLSDCYLKKASDVLQIKMVLRHTQQ